MYVLVAIKKGKVKVTSSSSETGDLTKEREMCFLFWVKDKPQQIDVFIWIDLLTGLSILLT